MNTDRLSDLERRVSALEHRSEPLRADMYRGFADVMDGLRRLTYQVADGFEAMGRRLDAIERHFQAPPDVQP